MDRRNLGSELKSTTLSGREFQVFMMRSLKNAALKREALCFLNNLYWWPLVCEHVLNTKNSSVCVRLFYGTDSTRLMSSKKGRKTVVIVSFIMQHSPESPHYALHPSDCLSVRLSQPLTAKRTPYNVQTVT